MKTIKNKSRRSQSRRGNRKTRASHQTRKMPQNGNKSRIVVRFLEILNMIKLYHWKTRSYSQHKATDELYDKMNENIDKFVEVLLGKDQSRLTLLEKKMNLSDGSSGSSSFQKSEFQDRLLEFRKFLVGLDRYFDDLGDSDLMNIRDEILADLNQFLYLMSFDK
jgi:DNA-binding ferritin-like protein